MAGILAKRKISEDIFSSSSKSVITTLNKFINSVNDMNSTVLVPSKLLDIENNKDNKDTECFEGANRSDLNLSELVELLNEMKNELVLGHLSDYEVTKEDTNKLNNKNNISQNKNLLIKKINEINVNNEKNNNVINSNNNLLCIEERKKKISSASSFDSFSLVKGNNNNTIEEVDDGFSSLNSYSRNYSDFDDTSSSSEDDENTTSPASTVNNSIESCKQVKKSTPSNNNVVNTNVKINIENCESECLLNIFRHHVQGLQNTLTLLSKYADYVSDVYVKNSPDL